VPLCHNGGMRKLTVFLALMALIATACGTTTEPTLLSASDAAAFLQDAPEGLVVLDVRTPEEFTTGHLSDAVLLDFYESDFADSLAELDRDTPYFVYCRSGNRSGQTIQLMQTLGFTNVTELSGGINEWNVANLPLK
jgi:phage shock protein E